MSDSLYELLSAAADRHPDRLAVDFAERRLTYRELLEGADRAAALFARLGAGPGRRAAFCFRKSPEALAALFGLIRAGVTYVPLDPSWPAERCATICRDAGVALWTGTDASHAPPGVPVIAVQTGDTAATPLAAVADEVPLRAPPVPPAEGLANILYTSGSTGRPKGVRITTRSLLHFSKWSVDYFGLTAEDRVANHAPYNFDLSTFDIFAAARAGACMCPVPERVKMFPYPMAAFIAARRISVWYSVPSALAMMQQRGGLADHDFSRLRHVIFAGEVMPKPLLVAWAQAVPHAALTNLYGPTETNVCTFHRVTAEDLADAGPLPIGRPIADTRVWLGEDGEILVAGPTVTDGYFGDEAMTRSRLVPLPDEVARPPSAGANLVAQPPSTVSVVAGVVDREFEHNRWAFRTADRARFREDGVLMFEGRRDRMLKIRGHRVEPGEIEAVLTAHPAVAEAAVIAIPDADLGTRLKACVAARAGRHLDEAALTAFCRERLPPYMVPDAWSFLPALPRTDRGKVDLPALVQ